MLQVTHENLRRLITNDAPKRTYRMSAVVQGLKGCWEFPSATPVTPQTVFFRRNT